MVGFPMPGSDLEPNGSLAEAEILYECEPSMVREKTEWEGELVSIQPRIRLLRSFDERSHIYLGYSLFFSGSIQGEDREFSVGIGPGAQQKHGFRVGTYVFGGAEPVLDPRLEPVEFYKAVRLRILQHPPEHSPSPPPWLGIPPALEDYRARGHRRLAAATYSARCAACIWGCKMAVEMIIDHWNPRVRRHREETFCYGPKSCPSFKSGPTRKVPGRRGMSWEEEDWVDEEDTAHRGFDE